MNRRELLSSTGAGMALGLCAAVAVAAPGCVPEPAAAVETDPAILAIERHRGARSAWDANKAHMTEDEWLNAGAAESEAWEALTQTVPTTLAGLAAMAAYVERYMTRAGLPFELGARLALLNIAAGAAAMEART